MLRAVIFETCQTPRHVFSIVQKPKWHQLQINAETFCDRLTAEILIASTENNRFSSFGARERRNETNSAELFDVTF